MDLVMDPDNIQITGEITLAAWVIMASVPGRYAVSSYAIIRDGICP